MSDETWLIDRETDASKKISVARRILVFDFELFIGALGQKEELTTLSSCKLFDDIGRSVWVYSARATISSSLRALL